MEQLILELSEKPKFYFDNFYDSPKNQGAVNYLKSFLQGERDPMLYIYGPTGVGKSHLLQAACQELPSGQYGIYLPLKTVLKYSASVFENLSTYSLIAIDEIEALPGHAEFEEGIFHLFNQIQNAGKRLLMAAQTPAAWLDLKLPDLASRMKSVYSLEILALSENDLRQLIETKIKQAGLVLSEGALEFLFKRLRRDLKTLSDVILRLDRASLTAQRKVTIPFIKEVLEL